MFIRFYHRLCSSVFITGGSTNLYEQYSRRDLYVKNNPMNMGINVIKKPCLKKIKTSEKKTLIRKSYQGFFNLGWLPSTDLNRGPIG